MLRPIPSGSNRITNVGISKSAIIELCPIYLRDWVDYESLGANPLSLQFCFVLKAFSHRSYTKKKSYGLKIQNERYIWNKLQDGSEGEKEKGFI